jgi:hypothetical protein
MKWAGFKVKRASLCEVGLDGQCDFNNGVIKIEKTLEGETELDTYIHEGLHALNPDASETWVTNNARLLANLLTKVGYRRSP